MLGGEVGRRSGTVHDDVLPFTNVPGFFTGTPGPFTVGLEPFTPAPEPFVAAPADPHSLLCATRPPNDLGVALQYGAGVPNYAGLGICRGGLQSGGGVHTVTVPPEAHPHVFQEPEVVWGQGGIDATGYEVRKAVELLESEGMPAYVALGQDWVPRLLLLHSGRHLYVVEGGFSSHAANYVGESPCFGLADLCQVTKRTSHGRHALALHFEEGRLLLRFSFPSLLEAFVLALTSARRVPIVEVRS